MSDLVGPDGSPLAVDSSGEMESAGYPDSEAGVDSKDTGEILPAPDSDGRSGIILARPNELTIEARLNDQALSIVDPGGNQQYLFIKVMVDSEDAAKSIAAICLNAAQQQLQALVQQQAIREKKILPATSIPNRAARRQMERLTKRA